MNRGAILRLVSKLLAERGRGGPQGYRGGRRYRAARKKAKARFYRQLADPSGALFKCPMGGHWHTNPDGSRIFIRALRMRERSRYDWTLEDWVLQQADKEDP